jgi:ABC-type branched-subunit amino acid transport system substrate-binding protein
MGSYATCQLGLKSFTVLAPSTPYGEALARAFSHAVEAGGGSVRHQVTYAPEPASFRNEARELTGRADPAKRPDYIEAERKVLREISDPFRQRKALEKLRKSLPPLVDFDAVFIADGWKTASIIAPALAFEDLMLNGCEPQEVELVQRTLQGAQLPKVQLLGWGGWSSPELKARGGKAVDCAVWVDGFSPDSSQPGTRRFVHAFGAAHDGAVPNLLNAVGYDSAKMLLRVWKTHELETNPDRFRDALADLSGFNEATGPTAFNHDRQAQKPLFLLRQEPSGVKDLPVSQSCRMVSSR